MTPQLDGKGCTFCKVMQVEEHSMQFQEAQKGFLSFLKKKIFAESVYRLL